MRQTTNLELTQFDGTDIPNWLVQYNSDMAKLDANAGAQGEKNTEIDTRFTNLEQKEQNDRTQINENTQDITNLKQTTIPEINRKITSLETESGTADSRLEALEDAATNLENKVGNSTSPFEKTETVTADIQQIAQGRLPYTVTPASTSIRATGNIYLLRANKHLNVVEAVIPTLNLVGQWTAEQVVDLGSVTLNSDNVVLPNNCYVHLMNCGIIGDSKINLYLFGDSATQKIHIRAVASETHNSTVASSAICAGIITATAK